MAGTDQGIEAGPEHRSGDSKSASEREMHSRDVWQNLGTQFSSAGEWMRENPAGDKLHGLAFFTDQLTSDYMAQGKTQEEARELAYAAAQAVIAVQLFEEGGGEIVPSIENTSAQ